MMAQRWARLNHFSGGNKAVIPTLDRNMQLSLCPHPGTTAVVCLALY